MTDDLLVLAACQNIKAAVGGIIDNHKKLGTRPIHATFMVHPQHDPGCLKASADILRSQRKRFDRAVVVLDRSGCGDTRSRIELESSIEEVLCRNGWEDRCAAVVIDPELEAWVWSDSPHVDGALGWEDGLCNLRKWLTENGHSFNLNGKPEHPKRAVEDAMRSVQKRRTSAIYKKLAQLVSFQRCNDPAFKKFCDKLAKWFGEQAPHPAASGNA